MDVLVQFVYVAMLAWWLGLVSLADDTVGYGKVLTTGLTPACLRGLSPGAAQRLVIFCRRSSCSSSGPSRSGRHAEAARAAKVACAASVHSSASRSFCCWHSTLSFSRPFGPSGLDHGPGHPGLLVAAGLWTRRQASPTAGAAGPCRRAAASRGQEPRAGKFRGYGATNYRTGLVNRSAGAPLNAGRAGVGPAAPLVRRFRL